MSKDKRIRKGAYRFRHQKRTELTGYEVKAPLLFRIVFHLAGEQVEFSWRPVCLTDRKTRTERGGRVITTNINE